MSIISCKIKTKHLCETTEEGATAITTHCLCCPPTNSRNTSSETCHTSGGHKAQVPVKVACEQPDYARHTDYEPEVSWKNTFGPATSTFQGKL